MTDFEDFGSRVTYEMEGWVHEDIDTDNFTRATESQLTTEADLKFDELLFANIINLDSWLHVTWKERMAREIEIHPNRTFVPNWDEVTVRLDLYNDEVIEAAEKRAAEDHTEAAYVLGGWVHLAEKRDHIPSAYDLQSAYERVAEREDQPDDSTTEEHHGGRR